MTPQILKIFGRQITNIYTLQSKEKMPVPGKRQKKPMKKTESGLDVYHAGYLFINIYFYSSSPGLEKC